MPERQCEIVSHSQHWAGAKKLYQIWVGSCICAYVSQIPRALEIICIVQEVQMKPNWSFPFCSALDMMLPTSCFKIAHTTSTALDYAWWKRGCRTSILTAELERRHLIGTVTGHPFLPPGLRGLQPASCVPYTNPQLAAHTSTQGSHCSRPHL